MMSGDQGYGVKVEIDSIRNALQPTRAQRLALDVLWGKLLPGEETDAIYAAFYAIDEQLRTAELADLRRYGLTRDYFIISPINPMNPPGPEAMEKVAAALRTLDDLGLIITL